MARKKDTSFADMPGDNGAPDTEQFSESYLSMGLGLLVVLVVAVLIYNFFIANRNKQSNQTTQEEIQQVQQEASPSAETTGKYTVNEGDTLWSISEKYYQTGFNWPEIAKLNNIVDPNTLETGQVLTLPKVQEAQKMLPDTGVADTTHIVQENDTLWDIACSAYNDCYAWGTIAEANSLADPRTLEVGTQLTIPAQ